MHQPGGVVPVHPGAGDLLQVRQRPDGPPGTATRPGCTRSCTARSSSPPARYPASSTAPDPAGEQRVVRVTHPFHPWRGGSSCSWRCGRPGARIGCSSSTTRARSARCRWAGRTRPSRTCSWRWRPGGARSGSTICSRWRRLIDGLRDPARRSTACKADSAADVKTDYAVGRVDAHASAGSFRVSGMSEVSADVLHVSAADDVSCRHNGYLHRCDSGGGGGETPGGSEAGGVARGAVPEPAAGGGRDEAFAAARSSSTRAIWCRSSTRWCAGSGSTGQPVSAAAAAFGFSRPSFYEAAAAVDAGGLARAGAGPAGAAAGAQAHRGGRRVRAPGCARRTRRCARAHLVEAIAERFGVRVHPRSVERALARAAAPKSGEHGETSGRAPRGGRARSTSSATSSCARSALGRATPGGWRLGLGVLHHRGVAAWLRALATRLPAAGTRAQPPGCRRLGRSRRRPRARRRRSPRWRSPAWPRGDEPR